MHFSCHLGGDPKKFSHKLACAILYRTNTASTLSIDCFVAFHCECLAQLIAQISGHIFSETAKAMVLQANWLFDFL